jgi:hypothetical protein
MHKFNAISHKLILDNGLGWCYKCYQKSEVTMIRAIYRKKDDWVLCSCNNCGTLNYVEPHGTTAYCKQCKTEKEHISIPYELRDISRCFYIVPKTLKR